MEMLMTRTQPNNAACAHTWATREEYHYSIWSYMAQILISETVRAARQRPPSVESCSCEK